MGHSLIKDTTGESQNVFLETTKLMIKHTLHMNDYLMIKLKICVFDQYEFHNDRQDKESCYNSFTLKPEKDFKTNPRYNLHRTLWKYFQLLSFYADLKSKIAE